MFRGELAEWLEPSESEWTSEGKEVSLASVGLRDSAAAGGEFESGGVGAM